MDLKWRKYLSPCFLKFRNQLERLKLYTFIDFLRVETMTIYHEKYKLIVRYYYDNKDELHFSLFYLSQNPVFSCTLKSLNANGRYFQMHIARKTKDILPKISFAAVFQKIIRENRNYFHFIKEIYSTSPDNSLSNSLSLDGQRFWEKQVENNFAIWIEEEKRFRAILD